MAELTEDSEQKINQLQILEQSLQNITLQKQQFQAQLLEFDAALEEIEKSEDVYKVVGNIMVLVKKDKIKEELENKKEISGLRVKNIEKQENSIREKAKKLQEEVMQNMK